MFPLFTTRYLHVRHDVRDPQRRKWELWARMLSGNFAEMTTSTPFRQSFTCRKSTTWDRRLYFPSEGRRAEDFSSPLKIRRLRPGLNPRTWVLKVSTLPLDHRNRSKCVSVDAAAIIFHVYKNMSCGYTKPNPAFGKPGQAWRMLDN